MNRKYAILIGLCVLAILLSTSVFAQYQDTPNVLSSQDNVYIAEGNKIYSIQDGEFSWVYTDEGIISSFDLTDWNRDGTKDIVVASSSTVMPPLKIINGINGEPLKFFSLNEKTFAGNIPSKIESILVANSEIFVVSGNLLYKVDRASEKRINIFDQTISEISLEGNALVLSGNFRGKTINYYVDFNGNILRKQITNEGFTVREYSGKYGESSDVGNCPSQYVDSQNSMNTVISGVRVNQDQFYIL